MLQSIDEKPYTEILDGEAVQKVSPKTIHSLVQARVVVLLTSLAGTRGGVGTEWRFYLDPPGGLQTSLVPDVAFVTRERLRRLSGEEREKPPFAPDIAIEIRSPGDKLTHVEKKMYAYLKFGGTVAMDVIPETRTIRVFTHDGLKTYGKGTRIELGALPWLSFTVDEVFAGLDD